MTVVDAHLHLFESVSEQYPRDVFPGLTPPERRASMEEYFGYMERAGVDKAVIVAVSHHDEYVRDVVATRPDLFAIVGVQDVSAPDQLVQLHVSAARRRLSRGSGCSILMTNPNQPRRADRHVPGAPTDGRRRRQAVVLLPPEEQVLLLDRVLDHLPDLTVVVNHLGFCPSIWDEIRADEWGRPRFNHGPLPRQIVGDH